MLNDAIDRAAAATPARLALVSAEGQALDFARLAATVRGFAARLRAAGVRPGESVAPLVDNPAVRLALWIATLRIGAVPAISPRRILVEAGIDADRVVALDDQGAGHPGRIGFDASWRAAEGAAEGAAAGADAGEVFDEAGAIVASSGTTGLSKVMRYPPGAIAARNRVMNAAAGAPEGPVLVALNLNSPGGFRYAYRALAAGQGVILPGARPAETLARLAMHGATELTAPAPVLADLCDAAGAAGRAPRLARVETVGSAISAALLGRSEAVFGCRVTVMYGMTELATLAVGRPAGAGYEPGLVGPLAAGVELQVLDREIHGGRFGRLSFRVPEELRASPYLNAEGPFDSEGWMRTGDLGCLREDGQLVIAGRADEVINTGGKGWLPETFEAAALAQPGIARAAAFGAPGPGGYDAVWLAVVALPGFDPEVFAAALGAQFPGAGRIAVRVLDALPLNAAGKIDRAALRAGAA